MSRYDRPEDMSLIIADLQRRVQTLETSPRLPTFSTVSGGGLNVANGDLNSFFGIDHTLGWNDVSGYLPTADVVVGPSGRLWVLFGGHLWVSTPLAGTEAQLSVQISGANTQAPGSTSQVAQLGSNVVGATSISVDASVGSVVMFTDLLPGACTVALLANTNANFAVNGNSAAVSNPYLYAIAL